MVLLNIIVLLQYYTEKGEQLKDKPVNDTRDRSWKTNIIGQKSKNYYNHLQGQGSVSYKDIYGRRQLHDQHEMTS